MEYIALHLDGSERRCLICKLRGDATGKKRAVTGGSHLGAGARSRPFRAGRGVRGKDAAPAVHGDVGSSIRHFVVGAEVVVPPGDAYLVGKAASL
jgi:hypothetical protein